MEHDPPNSRLTELPFQTDGALFRDLQAGQLSALAALYDRYSRLVYQLALRILANPQEAEDLTQEVFLALWHQGRYDPARGSLSSFLTTMTRSRAIDKLRSRGTVLKLLQRWNQRMIPDAAPTPFEHASLRERSQHVRRALAELPDKQRRVLEMAYYQGLSQSEIAKQLDTPLGTVKSWARQGLLQLRRSLQELVG